MNYHRVASHLSAATSMMGFKLLSILVLVGSWSLVSAHTLVTYPGSRGDNIGHNGTFPQGLQWQYPCGAMAVTQNRTKWPVTGGSIGFEPGHFPGHATAFMYINMGLGNDPQNMTMPMVPVFQIAGPSREAYPGLGVCLHRVPLPVNVTAKVGDNATIQIVQAAIHGAALYNCIDITFAEPEEVAEVNNINCRNDTGIRFNNVYSSPIESAAAISVERLTYLAAIIPLLAIYLLR